MINLFFELRCFGIMNILSFKKTKKQRRKRYNKNLFHSHFLQCQSFYLKKSNGKQLFAHEIDFWTLVDKYNYFNDNCSNALILYFKSLYEDV